MMIYELEKQVMKKLLQGEEPILQRLRAQYDCASIVSMQHTGVGFYIDYTVPENNRNLPVDLRFCFGDVEAYLNDAEQLVGFLLWITNGMLDCLEAYTYDMPWPEDIVSYRVQYVKEPRDLRIISSINIL